MPIDLANEKKGLILSHYFGPTTKENIDTFIALVEKHLSERLNLWPHQAIQDEGFSTSEPIITAWKSITLDIKVIIVEDQSFKHKAKLIAFYRCPDTERQWLEETFKKVASRYRKSMESYEQNLSDQMKVKWANDNRRFLFIIFGFTAVGGGSFFYIFYLKKIFPPNNTFEISLLTLGHLIVILTLVGAFFFLFIYFFITIRIILKR